MDHEEDLNTFKTLAKSVILLAIPLFLIYEQPDMKNTLMLLDCILHPDLYCRAQYIRSSEECF